MRTVVAEQFVLQFPDPNQADAEEWRVIAAFPAYAVSSFGRIKRITGAMGTKVGRILRPRLRGPYYYMTFSIDRKESYKAVHTIVCETFHGPRPPGHQVCHGEKGSTDNSVGNLRWGTPQENNDDRVKQGNSGRGSKNPQAKLTENDVLDIKRALRDGVRKCDLVRKYGVHYMTIANIDYGLSWTWLVLDDEPDSLLF
jgi:hypothetical protein